MVFIVANVHVIGEYLIYVQIWQYYKQKFQAYGLITGELSVTGLNNLFTSRTSWVKVIERLQSFCKFKMHKPLVSRRIGMCAYRMWKVKSHYLRPSGKQKNFERNWNAIFCGIMCSWHVWEIFTKKWQVQTFHLLFTVQFGVWPLHSPVDVHVAVLSPPVSSYPSLQK